VGANYSGVSVTRDPAEENFDSVPYSVFKGERCRVGVGAKASVAVASWVFRR
jgi:hypothetical protein